MPTEPSSAATLPTTEPPLRLRKRPDLWVQAEYFDAVRYWVVKDPVALRYFHLKDAEHAILEMLDGRVGLGEIKRRFERQFAPLKLSLAQIHAFVGQLHRNGLVLSEHAGQGDQLRQRRDQRRRRELGYSAGAVLAIRLPGFDPAGLLDRLYPPARRLFSKPALAAAAVLVCAALLLVTLHADVLRGRLPDARSFFSAQNLFWLAVAFAGVKVLHELGHALTCRRFGSQCREMGLMLLVFTPCLYCDVSDTWMLRSKWQRIAVSAAGMAVELVLASLATLLWWLSEPGLLQAICLNVMFICSVGTLLFNGNPLLRYDGYYILSDLVEVPNLAQQSRDLADRLLSRFFLGPGPAGDRALPRRRRGLLLFYGLASMAYRVALVAAILWFCHKALAAYRLETVAALLVAVVVTGMLLSPAVRVWRAASAAARRDGFRWRRPLLRFLAALLVVVGLGLVPLPYSVRAPLSLELEDGRPVYVAVGGRLVECRRAGQTIHKGDVVARLENAALRREIAQLQSTRDRLVRELSGLVGRRNEDPAAAAQIPAAGEALADVEGRLRQRLGDENDLVLRTPVDGRVVPPAEKPRLPYGAAGIASWSGSPLSPRNAGCYLPTGELVCYVGPADRFEAVLAIDQSSLPLVRPGDAARIRLDCVGGEVFEGVVREIGKQQMRLAPREIATGGRLAVKPTASGGLAPTETSYYARVTVASRDPRLLVGARGQAKIRVGPQSLLGRLGRYLARTLRIEL